MGDTHDMSAMKAHAEHVKRRKALYQEAALLINGVARDLPKFTHEHRDAMGVFKLTLAEAAARLAVLEQEAAEPVTIEAAPDQASETGA